MAIPGCPVCGLTRIHIRFRFFADPEQLMLDKLQKIAHSRGYWLALAALGLGFIAVALFYQYVLETPPCVLCIQVRIWFAGLILIAIAASIFNKRRVRRVAHTMTVLIAAGLLERSYLLLGTERGIVFRDCGFDLGLPSWLALDTWLPQLFRVETTCGYTPGLLFGITMAQALIVFSALFLVISLALTLASFMRRHN